jgi:hypothetical protein
MHVGAAAAAAGPPAAAAAANGSLSAAIPFHSIKPSGAFEKRSMHGSCPVIKGEAYYT